MYREHVILGIRKIKKIKKGGKKSAATLLHEKESPKGKARFLFRKKFDYNQSESRITRGRDKEREREILGKKK